MSERNFAKPVASPDATPTRRWSRKAFTIGCFGILIVLMMCVAPVLTVGWFVSGIDLSPDVLSPVPSQMSVPTPSLTCAPDEWVMQWMENGVQRQTCVHRW